MRINPINYSHTNSFATKRNINNKAADNISFKSVISSAVPQNQHHYQRFLYGNKDFAIIKQHSTRMFRELPTELAMTKLLDSDKKTQINVLGCSDGSEAYAYAIALKENWGEKAKRNVNIKGVDLSPYMIELARTGKISCAEVERLYANHTENNSGSKSPLKGEGWEKYLTKTTAPGNYAALKSNYPFLRFLEIDPVANISIGRGLNWYKINTQDLPDITFEVGNMMNHTNSTKEVDAEVYVIANSAGYLLDKNPDDFIFFFNNVRNANKDNNKDIYVVTGDLERILLQTKIGNKLGISPRKQEQIMDMIDMLGFKKVSEQTLKKLGIGDFKEASCNIYRLER